MLCFCIANYCSFLLWSYKEEMNQRRKSPAHAFLLRPELFKCLYALWFEQNYEDFAGQIHYKMTKSR